MSHKFSRIITFAYLSFILVASFQNCGKGFNVQSSLEPEAMTFETNTLQSQFSITKFATKRVCEAANFTQFKNCINNLMDGDKVNVTSEISCNGVECCLVVNSKNQVLIEGNNNRLAITSTPRSCDVMKFQNSSEIIIQNFTIEGDPSSALCNLESDCGPISTISFFSTNSILMDHVSLKNNLSHAIFLWSCDGFVFSDSELSNTGVLGITAYDYNSVRSKNITILNSNFYRTRTNAIAFVGVDGDNLIEGNTFRENHYHGLWPSEAGKMYNGGQVYLPVVKNLVVKNNTFYRIPCDNCGYSGMQIELGGEINNYPVQNLIIESNYFYGNEWTDIYLNRNIKFDSSTIVRNNSHTGKSQIVRGSPSIQAITVGGSGSTTGSIKGYLDGINNGAIKGWACIEGKSQSIPVHLYLGGNYSEGVFIGEYQANVSSESAVSSECKSQIMAHRYNIPLSAEILSKYQGQKIYVYGISSESSQNKLLNNSGSFLIPTVVNPTPTPQSTPTPTSTPSSTPKPSATPVSTPTPTPIPTATPTLTDAQVRACLTKVGGSNSSFDSFNFKLDEYSYLIAKQKQLFAAGYREYKTYEQVLIAFKNAGLTPRQHFILYGDMEYLPPYAAFDVNYYLQAKANYNNSSIAEIKEAFKKAGLGPFQHYIRYGWYEGLDPSANFSTIGYLKTQILKSNVSCEQFVSDLKKKNISPLDYSRM